MTIHVNVDDLCACCDCEAIEQHHDLWWCYICIGRGHHQDLEWVAELKRMLAEAGDDRAGGAA